MWSCPERTVPRGGCTREETPRRKPRASRAAIGCYAMDRSITAAGNVQISFAVQRQAGRIHQLSDEWFHRIIRCDFVQRDRNLLSALPAVGDVNVPLDVHHGIGYRMKIVGNLDAEMKREGLALRPRGFHAHDAARGAIGHTRDQMILGGYQQARLGFTEAHKGARVRARHEPAAVNRNVSAGNSRSRENPIDAWYAVRVQVHSRIV